jgi:hypothetical protein
MITVIMLVMIVWIIMGAIIMRIKTANTMKSACTHDCDQGRHCTCDKTTEKE